MSGPTTDPLDVPFWLASRAAGIVAYILLSLAVVGGLMMATNMGGRGAKAWLRVGHERVALLALATLAVHGSLLLGDAWLRPSITQLLVPFTMDYRPLYTGLGTIAAYGAGALGLSHYARHRLGGTRRWRLVHRATPIAWALATIHVLGAGTDAGSLWLQIPLALSIATVSVLLLARLAQRPAAAAPAPAPAPAPPAEPAAVPPPPDTLWVGHAR